MHVPAPRPQNPPQAKTQGQAPSPRTAKLTSPLHRSPRPKPRPLKGRHARQPTPSVTRPTRPNRPHIPSCSNMSKSRPRSEAPRLATLRRRPEGPCPGMSAAPPEGRSASRRRQRHRPVSGYLRMRVGVRKGVGGTFCTFRSRLRKGFMAKGLRRIGAGGARGRDSLRGVRRGSDGAKAVAWPAATG